MNDNVTSVNFSMFHNETQDTAKIDQLSTVARCAPMSRSKNWQPVDMEVREIFLGFYAVTKHGEVDLANQTFTAVFPKRY